MSEELTTQESKEYARCNKIIKKNKSAFVKCGLALSTVFTQKLWRQNYKTFEEYCLKEHGFKKSQAYRMVDAVKTIEFSPIGENIENEGQAREFKDIPPGQHAEVIDMAVGKNGKLTAAAIKKAAEKVAKANVIETDKEGHSIPTPAKETWDRRDEVDEYLVWLSRIKSWAEKLQKTSDKFYAVQEFSAQEVYTDCGNLYRMIKNLVPYSICAVCQGQAPKQCALCHGKGMISKHTWDHSVDPVTKKMMKKKAEDDAPTRLSATGG